MKDEKLKEYDMFEILKAVAPGTPLRDCLENILKARMGALLVIGDSPEVLSVVDGGFYINKEYSSQLFYELAKMDGAIVISKDYKKFLYANALLIPNPSIATSESGTRHKAAERVAKQVNELVVCISQRRNVITLYKGNKKYILKDTNIILSRANQALQTLEKYKSALDVAINDLNILEFEDMVSLEDIAVVIQRTEMVMRIASEVERYICELGNEGRLISMQLQELLGNTEHDGINVIEDYMIYIENRTAQEVQKSIKQLSYEDLMDLMCICRILGFVSINNFFEVEVSPRGHRMINKIPRVPVHVVKNLIEKFGNLQRILNASIEELDDVEGIGEVRARVIKDGLRRVRDRIQQSNKKYV